MQILLLPSFLGTTITGEDHGDLECLIIPAFNILSISDFRKSLSVFDFLYGGVYNGN